MKDLISKDLIKLHSLLNSDKEWSKRVKNLESVRSVASKVKTGKESDFGYSNPKPIIFQDLDLGKRILPSILDEKPDELIYDISVKLSITLRGGAKSLDIYDPLSALNISIVVGGEYLYKDEQNEVIQSWHLDKNTGNKDHKKSNFVHPEYHMHFGGDQMVSKNELHFGDLLLLESPRFAQLPLDLPLAIDFVIRNFYEKEKNQKLLKNKIYKDVLANSQRFFWRPYFLGVAQHWLEKKNNRWADIDNLNIDNALKSVKLNPHIC
ncbi:MAG: hypothetical protein AAGA64_12055 [Bacteroidota bacterium]